MCIYHRAPESGKKNITITFRDNKQERTIVSSTADLKTALKIFGLAGLRASDGSVIVSYDGVVDGGVYTPLSAPRPPAPPGADSVTLRLDACLPLLEAGDKAAGPRLAPPPESLTFLRLTDADLRAQLEAAGAAGVVPLADGEDPQAVLGRGEKLITAVEHMEGGKTYLLVPTFGSSLKDKVRWRRARPGCLPTARSADILEQPSLPGLWRGGLRVWCWGGRGGGV